MAWCSCLLKNFPRFVVIHTFKGFSIVSEAEVDIFLELSCFFYDLADVCNLISDSSDFSKLSLYIWKFSGHILLKPASHTERSLASFPFCCFALFLCIVHLRSPSYLSLLFFGTLRSFGYIFPFLPCLSLSSFLSCLQSLLRQPLCLLAFLFP